MRFALFVLVLAAGCGRVESGYAPPAQRSLHLQPWELDTPFAEMDADDADEFIVRDISAYRSAWRWTYARPELRFILNCTAGQKFAADFSVAGETLRQTGPITVSFSVNEHLLGKVYCPAEGPRHFAKEVPAAWLSTNGYTRVTIQADKLYVAPADGARLGFLLGRAGFIESCGQLSGS